MEALEWRDKSLAPQPRKSKRYAAGAAGQSAGHRAIWPVKQIAIFTGRELHEMKGTIQPFAQAGGSIRVCRGIAGRRQPGRRATLCD